MKSANNLIVLATYWNEAQWINASLDQIARLSPDVVVICDGCFDGSQPNHSVDGTAEDISGYVTKLKGMGVEVILVSALRLNLIQQLFALFRLGRGVNFRNFPCRIYWALKYWARTSSYRINQSATFDRMLKLAKGYERGGWFMTLDADQFYPDEVIDRMVSITSNESAAESLIQADELTFPYDFMTFTRRYEKRTWNNMPHKIYPSTVIYPTRDIWLDGFLFRRHYSSLPSVKVGEYHHYKFRYSAEREKLTYAVGDRKPPQESRYSGLEAFAGKHPKSVALMLESVSDV